jgi:cyclophilin family peptidyl-prolyl cis-trans isomerase
MITKAVFKVSAILLVLAMFLQTGCDKKSQQTNQKDESTMAAQSKAVKVKISTNKGDIVVELNQGKAPITCENFLKYVDANYYDGTIFHRVIKGFMIQGGGMTADMRPKPTNPPIVNEAKNGLNNVRGSIAMARTSDPDSATSQFFINHADNDFLNYGVRDAGYAVFGKVVSGMEVVDAIASVKTKPGDVPVETVIINSIKVEQ